MIGKVLVIAFAFLAGAGGAYVYQLASDSLELVPHKEDPRVAGLESQLASVTEELHELQASRQSAGSEVEVLAARLNTLDEKLSKFQEKQSELAVAQERKPQDSLAATGSITGEAGSERTPSARISGEELVVALKEMPDEGKEMIRRAIHKEVQRIREEHEIKKDPRKKLEQDVAQGIKKAAVTLSLTPVQIEQAREIGARHIDKMVEAARIARETDDPDFARTAKKEIQAQTEQEIIQVLTPEQLDRMRELDPDGFGRRHPRGF